MLTTKKEKIKAEDHLGLAHAVASQFVRPGVRIQDTEEYAEACLHLVRATENYNPDEGTFQSVAWTCMKNGIIELHRKKNRKKRFGKFADTNLEKLPEKRTEQEIPPDELVYKFLADDPQETEQEKYDKLLLVEIYLGGSRVQAVAERLGISREAIYQRLRRTIERLREKHENLLEQYNYDERNPR